jgi:hypothetical protein
MKKKKVKDLVNGFFKTDYGRLIGEIEGLAKIDVKITDDDLIFSIKIKRDEKEQETENVTGGSGVFESV